MHTLRRVDVGKPYSLVAWQETRKLSLVLSHLLGFVAFLLDGPSRLGRIAYMRLSIKALELNDVKPRPPSYELRLARKAYNNAKYRLRDAERNLSSATDRLIKAAAALGVTP